MKYDHILDEMEINAEPFALCELHGQCTLGLGQLSGATLHYILAGNGECNLRDHPNIPLSKGSLVLVPANMSHSLMSFGYAQTPLPECHPAELHLSHHISRSKADTANQNLLALCGHITIGLRGATGLVDLIRQPIHVEIDQDSALDTTLTALLQELAAPKLGSHAIIRALLLQSMLHLFRDRLIANDPALTWMAAIGDPTLWGSLKVMLNQPHHPPFRRHIGRSIGHEQGCICQEVFGCLRRRADAVFTAITDEYGGTNVAKHRSPCETYCDQSRVSKPQCFYAYI